MIALLFSHLRWRLLALPAIAFLMYLLEPGFHPPEGFDPDALGLGPLGISATLSYFSGLSMIVLLGGFISTDRRYGYTRLFLAQPTSPLALYAARWALAYVISIAGATLFLVFGQLLAWGEFRGGLAGLILPLLSALIYGGIVAFFSTVLPRGDGLVAFLLFLPTFFPQLLALGLANLSPGVRQTINFLLPPQGAFQQIWDALIRGSIDWAGIGFAAVYGALFLAAAAILLPLREWP